MRPRRPGRSGCSNTTPAKQNQVTLKTCLEQTQLCPKDEQKRPLVQSGTHPNQIPPKRANPSHFQRDSVSKAGSHSSSRGSSLGHVNALWENVNGIQGKPEPLHYLFTEYLFFSLRTAASFLTTSPACSSPFSQSPPSLLPPSISPPLLYQFLKVKGLISHSK